MALSLLQKFFFISILSTIICKTNFIQAHNQCLDDQKTLLLRLKSDLVFSSSVSRKLVRWNQTDDCCSWEGVECDGAGHVISLQLDNEAISGGLENSSNLFSLEYLKKLNLAYNNFSKTQIPREIRNLTYLTHLNLSHAGFGGQVPVELSLLSRLVSLDMSENSHIQPLNDYQHSKMLFQNLTRLRELYLDGIPISAQGSKWCQVISSSLPDLRILSLSYCNLSSPLDPCLSQLQSLTELIHVDLSNNFFTGLIPPFHMFKKLSFINLSSNSLTGSLSSAHFEGLSNLVYINLEYNSLSGRIPQSLFRLPSLQTLILAHNQFSGQVDEFPTPHFSNIDYLDLSFNQLEGPIPEFLFQLESLKIICVSDNLFNGTFQLEKIQRLSNLTSLDLSFNKLSVDASSINSSLYVFPHLEQLYLASCNLYDFPDFRKQPSLTILDLSNNQIAGEIPSWIWEIGNGKLHYLNLSRNLLVDLQKPYHFPSSLIYIDLHSNRLRGELPPLPEQAYFIDYSNNNFDKPIPLDIGNFTSTFFFFSLANNSLSGAIPTSLCKSTNLQVLDLSFSNLSGDIPPCLFENIHYLQVLKLGNNNISGNIPDKFSVDCRLKTLDISNNRLGGNIPMSLANCKSLEVLNVGNNNINGSFPCMLPSSLHILVLRSNRFHGEVRCHSSWPDLQIIDIASNRFSGDLHRISFSSWRRMMSNSDAQLRRTNLGYNLIHSDFHYLIEVTLNIKGSKQKLFKILSGYTSIDFSSNNFQGQIPGALGDLSSLYLLNLSHNSLTGTIPKSFGNLAKLGSLDVSVNQLTGAIPVELARLTSLSILNLSYNKLVGMIPNGPQLQTFSADFFEGNTGLCGFPLNISCNSTDGNDLSPPKPETAQPGEKMVIEWGYVSAALGYVVGLGSIAWTLSCCQSLRRKYFEKVDELLEKIFGR